jgi:S-adenosylmethionine:tRNA ribosyltransferase-isomerase
VARRADRGEGLPVGPLVEDRRDVVASRAARGVVRNREERDDVRLLAIDTTHGRLLDRAATDLPRLLRPGDLLVLNDAATLPASLAGRAPSGEAIEIRLSGPADGSAPWSAVLFGAGDWRTRTEDRAPPPRLTPGDRIQLGQPGDLSAEVASVSPISPRLVQLRFDRDGAALLAAFYRLGRPVQYAHQDRDLALWTVQTAFAGRPWAVEMPSAGRPLSWHVLAAILRHGVELAWLTHAAGLSATGDPALDAALPLPERFHIPHATATAVARARAAGRRIIAVGTTVVRALEGAARAGLSGGGSGVTDLVLGGETRLEVVSGIVSGIHAPGESHFRLLEAFAPRSLLESAWRHAEASGYLQHELGDLCLVAPLPTDTHASGDSRRVS